MFCTILRGLVGSDVNKDDAFVSRGTPEREPVVLGEVTSVGGPTRLKQTMSTNELLQKEPVPERYSMLKPKRMFGHTRATASSHVEVPPSVLVLNRR